MPNLNSVVLKQINILNVELKISSQGYLLVTNVLNQRFQTLHREGRRGLENSKNNKKGSKMQTQIEYNSE